LRNIEPILAECHMGLWSERNEIDFLLVTEMIRLVLFNS